MFLLCHAAVALTGLVVAVLFAPNLNRMHGLPGAAIVFGPVVVARAVVLGIASTRRRRRP